MKPLNQAPHKRLEVEERYSELFALNFQTIMGRPYGLDSKLDSSHDVVSHPRLELGEQDSNQRQV